MLHRLSKPHLFRQFRSTRHPFRFITFADTWRTLLGRLSVEAMPGNRHHVILKGVGCCSRAARKEDGFDKQGSKTIMTSHTSRSRILLGIGGMTLIFPMLGMAEGFVDDTKATLTLRNAYFNRNFTNPAFPNSAAPQSKAEEWTQSFILDAKSGFTQGVVGFGVDVLGLYSLKLDGGKGTGGTQLLPIHSDGRPADDFGRLGVAGKARVSKTELKVGEWMPVLPILRSDDGRSLPQTFRGGQVTSKEIDGLTLYGGQFRGNSPRNDASMEDMSMNGRGAFTSDRFNFGGG
ncbi:OprD family outer membrane porin, partial [Pseudomonas ficuserectae]